MTNFTKRRVFDDSNDDAGISGGSNVNTLDPVISQTNTPAVGPTTGDRYLVGIAPTGVWVGNANSIAEWDGLDWVYTVPVADDYVYVTNTLTTLRFNGTTWTIAPGVAILQNGNSLGAGGVRIGSNDTGGLWFKTNNILRVRIDGSSGEIRTTNSIKIGNIVTAATARVHIIGAGSSSATYAIRTDNSTLTALANFCVRDDGSVGVGTLTPTTKLQVRTNGNSFGFSHTDGTTTITSYISGRGWLGTSTNHSFELFTNNNDYGNYIAFPNYTSRINGGAIASTSAAGATLDVGGTTSGLVFRVLKTGVVSALEVDAATGYIKMPILPTSSAGLAAGQLWNNLGILTVA